MVLLAKWMVLESGTIEASQKGFATIHHEEKGMNTQLTQLIHEIERANLTETEAPQVLLFIRFLSYKRHFAGLPIEREDSDRGHGRPFQIQNPKSPISCLI